MSGHGWDQKNQKSLDRNLWLGRVLHNRQIIAEPNSDNTKNNLLECLLFQNSKLEKELKSERQNRIACEEDGKQTASSCYGRRPIWNINCSRRKQLRATPIQTRDNNVAMAEIMRKLQTVNTNAKYELEVEKRKRMAAEEALSKGSLNQTRIIEQLRKENANLILNLNQLQQSEERRIQEKSECCCIVL